MIVLGVSGVVDMKGQLLATERSIDFLTKRDAFSNTSQNRLPGGLWFAETNVALVLATSVQGASALAYSRLLSFNFFWQCFRPFHCLNILKWPITDAFVVAMCHMPQYSARRSVCRDSDVTFVFECTPTWHYYHGVYLFILTAVQY